MPTELRMTEGVIDAFVAKLRNGMPGRVAALNAAAGDDWSLEPPADESYYTSGVQSIPLAPAIIVTDGGLDLTSEGDGPHSFLAQQDVLVYVLEQDPDRQTLGRRLWRQTRAVTETLWDDDPREDLDIPGVYRIFPVATRPGSVFEPLADDSWRGFYVVVFRVLMLEGQ